MNYAVDQARDPQQGHGAEELVKQIALEREKAENSEI